ncbi:MAG: Fur family transcriptional regulator [Pseudodesulfovibrio sp.]
MRAVDHGLAVPGRSGEEPGCPFARALRRRAFKRTAQREAVWDVLCRTEEHLTPEALLEEAATRGHSLSIATVYRTLKLFRQSGIVRRLEFGDGQSRYERLGDSESHLHLVCERCGQAFDVKDPEVIRRYRELAAAYAFVLRRQSTCLYGVCDSCARKATIHGKGDRHA